MQKDGAVIGISDHGGWAIFVTAMADGTLLDRRRVELVDDDLPAIPHHHEAQMLPIDDAIALVERVRASAERHAAIALETLASAISSIGGVALRACPPLPATIAERLSDYRSRNVADWVMYRQTLAAVAESRGWSVEWFDPKTVFDRAAAALRVEDFDSYFLQMRKSVGPPWNNDHKVALAGALASANNSVENTPANEATPAP